MHYDVFQMMFDDNWKEIVVKATPFLQLFYYFLGNDVNVIWRKSFECNMMLPINVEKASSRALSMWTNKNQIFFDSFASLYCDLCSYASVYSDKIVLNAITIAFMMEFQLDSYW